LEGNFVEKKEISGYGEGNYFLGSGNTAFVTTLFILLEGEHFILSLINIETVRTLAEK
jgi:hypothetical protein